MKLLSDGKHLKYKAIVRFFGIGLLSLAACKQTSYVSTAGFILGPQSEIERLDNDKAGSEIKEIANSTVLIATKLSDDKRKFCSGTLIEGSADQKDRLRVLTNFHCFAKTDERGEVLPEFLEESCQHTSVYLNFTYDNAAEVEDVPCMLNSLSGDYTGDIAVFTLAKAIDDNYKPLSFWKDDGTIPGRDAFIIHHPDVKSNYIRVGKSGTQLPAASITENNCKTLPPFKRDEWPLDHTLPYSTPHTCDLIHGSSGSALLDKETGQILGVNWGGIEIKYKSKSELYNAATRANYVQAFLSGDLKAIQKKVADSSSAGDNDASKKNKPLTDGTISKSICGVVSGGMGRGLLPLLWFLAPLGLAFARPKHGARRHGR
jgi:hypothetical protein